MLNPEYEPDSMPVVIAARYRIARRLAIVYGFEAYIVVYEGENPSKLDTYDVLIKDDKSTDMCLIWDLKNPRSFHKGIEAAHVLLELRCPTGLNLYGVLSKHEEEVSVATKATVAPFGG